MKIFRHQEFRSFILSKRSLFFTLLLFWLHPQFGFAFSESELDSLENSGKKTFSKSPWRTGLSFGLQRNVSLNTFHFAGYEAQQSAFSIDEKGSLLDISSLYYSLGVIFNYSLSETATKLNYDFLKNTELFLAGSFETPFTGYNSHFEKYDAWQYFHYALGDITFGFATPIYNREKFFTDLSFSSLLPLSKFSQEAGLFSGINGNLNFLYFLQKKSNWSIVISSSHALYYRHHTKTPLDRAEGALDRHKSRNDKELTHDRDGRKHSTPWSTRNSGSVIFKQSSYKAFPTRVSFNLGHTFGIDTRKTRTHYLSWSGASSWKIKDRFYLNMSIRWIDSIHISNPVPKHEDITKNQSIGWDDLRKYVFSIGGSYSF